MTGPSVARRRVLASAGRILIAEDEAVVALDLRQTVEELGYEVTAVVGSGEEALRSVEEDPPDIALLDIRMPGVVDGIDVGESLMRRRGIPVVYVTAYGDPATLDRALEESPYGYVLKPFRRRELNSAIRIALERRAMERKISARERHVRATLRSIGEGVVATDAEGRVEFVNPSAERLIGLDPSRAAGRRVEDVVRFRLGDGEGTPPHPVRQALDRRAVVQLVENCILEGHDGRATPVSDSAAPILTAEGDVEGCVLVVRDDTRIREMTEHIEDVFWITSPDKGQMEYLSPAFEHIWGRPREEVYRAPSAWVEAIHEGDRERVRRALPKQATGEYEMEYRIVRPDGSVRWIHDRAFPVKDEAGELLRIVGVAEDVTERMELTRRRMQRQKLEAVGQLAGGVAHDFNNLLTVIGSQTELVLQELPADSALREELGLVRASAERARRLTSHLLAFSRQQMLRPTVASVNEVVEELAHILDRLLGEDIRVDLDLQPDLPPIRIDVGQLEQALINLAVNARDAMPEGGTLQLSTHVTGEGPAEDDELGGPWVVLAISDPGVGMDEDVQEQAFDPFFTTKEHGEGTGLGLAMVYGLVRQSGGRIDLESAPGRGTTVTLRFPAVDGDAQDLAEAGRPAAPRSEERPMEARILLVEDDDVVRRVVLRILDQVRGEVTAASDAEEALRLLEEGTTPDVVITDMGLPGMKGSDLIREIRRRWPGMPVIAISGYPKGAHASTYEVPQDIVLVAKPFTPRELLSHLRSALGELG